MAALRLLLLQKPKDSSKSNSWKWYLRILLFIGSVGVVICIHVQTLICIKKVPETDLKYILLWTERNLAPFYYWKSGRQTFIDDKCPVSNCYIKGRGNYSDDYVSTFDAIIFNGRSLKNRNLSHMPKKRSYHQKYIFLNMESADNQPICNPVFNGFFNLTATYKLNSDIVYSYLLVKNMVGEEVGPRIDMTWRDDMSESDNKFLNSLNKKTKAAAWFVSHCSTRSKRETYARKLKSELKRFNLTLDVYGKCGDMSYPKSECEGASCKNRNILKDTYYFYLSFENSFAEDYVTEKLYTALEGNAVPIAYGGANYSRFLPPGSYLDARKHSPAKLASLMARIIRTPSEYHKFFKWKSQYSYHKPGNVCRLCAAINDQANETQVYWDFRKWWNPNYVKRCKTPGWGA